MIAPTTRIEPVRKRVRVEAPIAHAFEVFTAGLAGRWPGFIERFTEEAARSHRAVADYGPWGRIRSAPPM